MALPTAFLLVSMLPLTWADQNPPGCTDSGPALFIRTLRDTNADGIPDTSFSGSIREGEVIGYVCRLVYDEPPQCGYQGGQLRFDPPPSGLGFTDVTGGTIPLLCDAPECDPQGQGEYLSVRTDYIANHSDANQACANPTDVRGVCRYENGTSHRDADEEFPISAETPACTTVRYCGDNIVQTTDGETCDPPGAAQPPTSNACRSNCTFCGDGHQDAGEACDDGNGVNTDNCRNDCTVPRCGDGILDTSRGETCDPPGSAAGGNGNSCRADCTVCGDGHQDAGEACDDGNGDDTDSCRNDCTVPACGDGTINQTCETCDTDDFPGGVPSTHGACRTGGMCGVVGCTFCGDAAVNGPAGAEACDDGNDVDTDDCHNDCTLPTQNAICRTPGFWGTHAGTEKNRSVNITEAVIDCADGNCLNHTASDYLNICGEKIDSPDSHPGDGTTDVNDAASSTEAICVPVQGSQILQLARQLTAAALNCIISGGGANCAGTPLYSAVFSECNSLCASGTATKAQLTACISEVDCLNNGNTFNSGICSSSTAGNSCHDRPLANDDLGLNFEPPGPAGSSDACNAAHKTPCTVVGGAEGPPYTSGHCGGDSLP